MVQMEAGRLNKFLQNIEDFVFIEEKIVTCVWLCQALKIHVNTAKQLLNAFLQGDGVLDKVLVTYVIGGDLKDGSGKQIKLVEDGIRESTKSFFSRLTIDHIYSIQKAGDALKPIDLYNSHPQFLVNTDGPRFSAVQPTKEIEKREVKLPVIVVPKDVPLKSSKPVKPEEKNVDKQKPANNAEEPPSKQKKASPEKNSKQPANKAKPQGIAGMFSRQAEKKKVESPAEKPEIKEVKKKAGGISGFLQKQPAKKESPEPEPMETDADLPIKETNNKVEHKKKESKEEKAKQSENENQKSSVKDKKLKGKENRKKRKKRDEEKEDVSRKKRKRIMSLLSSDSESSGEGESECEMEAEPPPAATEPVPDEEDDIIPPTPGRKRVRKQIDKTYTDEDGFILTKKEYVYESCTDDEDSEVKNGKENEDKTEVKPSPIEKNEDKKPSSKKSPSTKHISPNNNKSSKQQASIMNFFKRK